MKTLLSLLVVLVLSSVSIAQAQQRAKVLEPYGENVFRQLMTIQLERSLESPLAMVRAQTLKNAVVFSTLYRERIDLTNAIPRIAEIAKNDESYQNRRLALATLHAIGSARANQHLAQLETMQEDEYRSLVAGVISEYYQLHRAGAM